MDGEMEKKLDLAQKELAQVYLEIAAHYKRMSKVRDNLRQDIMQEAVYGMLDQVTELRGKIDVLSKAIMDEWNSRRNEHRYKNQWEMPLQG